jgi:hypothetical protein
MPAADAHAALDPTPPESTGSPAKPVWDPGRPVREFEAICARNRLNCGSPEALAPFQRALDENKQLAMNFWSVVARLSDATNGPGLNETAILAAIVRAVTGEEIDQLRESQGPAIDRLARLLAGEDVSLNIAPPALPPAGTEVRTDAAAAIPEAADPPRTQEEIEPPAPRSSEESPVIGARLALQSEPPRILAAAIAAAAQLDETAQPPATGDSETAPAVPSSADAIVAPQQIEEEPRLILPLSAYATEHPSWSHTAGSAAFAVLLLAALCGGGLLLARNRTAVASWLHPSSTTPANSVSAPSAVANPQTAAPVAAATASQAPPAAPTPLNASRSFPQGEDAIPTERIAASHRRADNIADAQEAPDDAAQDAALPQVSAEEMRGHLISSRFPIVPGAANADAITGVVTLHAVITANGTVEHVSAVSGPEDLRQPAIDAVSSWHYRPYLVDGAPADVGTTIRVDFSGKD